MSEPTTEAGRALLDRMIAPRGSHEAECATCLAALEQERADESVRIVAIETEARQQERDRIAGTPLRVIDPHGQSLA